VRGKIILKNTLLKEKSWGSSQEPKVTIHGIQKYEYTEAKVSHKRKFLRPEMRKTIEKT
jgi:hypothetical protein